MRLKNNKQKELRTFILGSFFLPHRDLCLPLFGEGFFFVSYLKGQDILRLAVQDQAQFIDGGRGNGLPVGHTAERIAADTIVVDQGIFRDTSLFHCLPKVIVADHMDTSDNPILCYM